MGLREDALAAAEAARLERIDSARAQLAAVLAPSDVASLTVAAELPAQVVFTDGTICLAVADVDGTVTLVDGAGSEWSSRGPVKDLASLGLLLGGTA